MAGLTGTVTYPFPIVVASLFLFIFSPFRTVITVSNNPYLFKSLSFSVLELVQFILFLRANLWLSGALTMGGRP